MRNKTDARESAFLVCVVDDEAFEELGQKAEADFCRLK